MLNGPIAGKLVRFALPLAAAGILQQLFNSTDVAVVGRFDSTTAQAAVGASGPLINLMVTLFTGISLGLNVCVASLIGSGERKRIEPAEHTGIMLSLVCGLITIALGEALADPLLRIMSTPESVIGDAVIYLRIFFVAIAFQLVYDFAASVLRGSGDSSRPMYVLAVSSVINLVFDLLLVAGVGMGIAGAAIATVIANAFSAGAVLLMLARDTGDIHFSPHALRIERRYLRTILSVGLPAGLQGAIFSVSNMIIQAGINAFGPEVIDGNAAALSFEYLTYYVVYAFAQGATTFTSANFSARDPARCRRVYRAGMLLGIGLSSALAVTIAVFRSSLVLIFTSDPGVIPYAELRILFVTMLNGISGTYEVPGGCLRGMRHSTVPTVITAIGSCVVRILWVWVVMPLTGMTTYLDLVIIFPLSWAGMGVAMNIIYFKIRREEFAHMAQTAVAA
ncbi:MAG: MATE family efflux transporter [Tractidigestivibacter sp.]|uniref:MATE family efflux transporter n=1 Tax=Tractidigestivibacter sp. TaxID=2847320 RepID=UPI003D8A5045